MTANSGRAPPWATISGMADVRLVDLEVFKRYSLAIRQESAPVEEVLAVLDATRRQIADAVGGPPPWSIVDEEVADAEAFAPPPPEDTEPEPPVPEPEPVVEDEAAAAPARRRPRRTRSGSGTGRVGAG